MTTDATLEGLLLSMQALAYAHERAALAGPHLPTEYAQGLHEALVDVRDRTCEYLNVAAPGHSREAASALESLCTSAAERARIDTAVAAMTAVPQSAPVLFERHREESLAFLHRAGDLAVVEMRSKRIIRELERNHP